jgi:4-hydroxymandelate synthase
MTHPKQRGRTTVVDIAYLEFYAIDGAAAVNYFTSSFGFTEMARSEDRGRVSTGLRQGDIRLLVTAGSETRDFLDQHGEGIADVAFQCGDPAAVRDRACAAGATALGPTKVSGVGGVGHTLVPHVSGRWWSDAAGSAARSGAEAIRLLDHVAICVEGGTLQAVADLYTVAFGLERYYSEYVEVGEQAMGSIVLRNDSGTVTFTLVEPDTTKSPGQLDGFLARNAGPGVQHLAFLVDDVVSAVRDLRGRGVDFLSTPDTYYSALAERLGEMVEKISDLREAHVLADRDEWGYLLQLFSRSPFARDTLFFELIERHGAQGFGSANIRALYEAVERARAVTA